jgi:hypothetical protein
VIPLSFCLPARAKREPYRQGARDLPILEQRTIEFRAVEILQAIRAASRQAEAIGLRPGRIDDVEFQPTQQQVVFRETGPGGMTIEVAADALMALLVAYCSRTQIPLPRKADKQLEVGPNHVIIRLAVQKSGVQMEAGVRQEYPTAVVWPLRPGIYEESLVAPDPIPGCEHMC